MSDSAVFKKRISVATSVIKQLESVSVFIILLALAVTGNFSWTILVYGVLILINSHYAKQGREEILWRPAFVFLILMTVVGDVNHRYGGLLATLVYGICWFLSQKTSFKINELMGKVPAVVRETLIALAITAMVLQTLSQTVFAKNTTNQIIGIWILALLFVIISIWKVQWKWLRRAIMLTIIVLIGFTTNWTLIGGKIQQIQNQLAQTDLANWIIGFTSPQFWGQLLPQSWAWDWRVLLYIPAALMTIPEIVGTVESAKKVQKKRVRLDYGNVFKLQTIATLLCSFTGVLLPIYAIGSVGAWEKRDKKVNKIAGISLIVVGLIPVFTLAFSVLTVLLVPVFSVLLLLYYWRTAKDSLEMTFKPFLKTMDKLKKKTTVWPRKKDWFNSLIVIAVLVIAVWVMPIIYLGSDYLVKIPFICWGTIISIVVAFWQPLWRKIKNLLGRPPRTP